MNLKIIYAKTASGLRVRTSLFGGISSQMKRALDLVDGHKSLNEIFQQLSDIPEVKRIAVVEQLEKDGYIKYLRESNDEEDEWALDTVFAPMQVEEVDTIEEMESSLALDVALLAQLEERQRLDIERKAQEIELQIRAKEQAKLEAEAKKNDQLELLRKNEIAEREKLAAQAKELEAAKEKSRLEAEQIRYDLEIKAQTKALEEAKALQELKIKEAEAAKVAAEHQARQEAEEKIRLESEKAIRSAEEKQRKENDNLIRAKLEAQALVEKIHAKEQARREQVRVAREAEAALRKAQDEARIADEAKQAEQLEAKVAAEKAARAEAEEKAIAEAKERGRLEGERILREEKLAQQKLEAQAQAKALEEARLIAEQLAAKAAAEEKAIAEAKELERIEVERLAQEAEEEQRKLEAQAYAKAEEEARLVAEQQAAKVAAEERLIAEAKERARLEAERLAQEAVEKQQRQLEAELREKAQEEARLAAQKEAEASAQAKENARLEKERIAQQKTEEKAKAKQQALARKEAERSAKADKKAALKAEKAAQELAKKQAKADVPLLEDGAEIVSWKVLEAQIKRKKTAKRVLRLPHLLPKVAVKKWLTNCFKFILVYLPIFTLLLVGLMHLVNLSVLIEPIQTIVSASVGEPVKVGEVRASVWPQPHLVLNQVQVGKNQALNIQSVQVFPVMTTLLDDNKVINSVLVDGMDIDQHGFASPMQWLANANKYPQLNIQAISFNHIQLRIRDMVLGTFDGQVTKDNAQHWHGIELGNAEKSIFATVTPFNQDYKWMITGQHWPLPFSSKVVFDNIKMQGTYQQDTLSFNQINGEILGGKLTSAAALTWADGWQLAGDFKLNQVNSDEVFKTFGSTNLVDGKLTFLGKFSSQSSTFNALADAMNINGNFEILDSKINGIDLPHTIATPADRSLEGYATNFDQLTGSLQVNHDHFEYRNLVLKSPKLQAQGQLDVDAEHNVSGKITANLITSSRRFQERLNLTGKVNNVKRQ